MVIKAKVRFVEQPEKKNKRFVNGPMKLYAEVTGGASRKLEAPRKAAPKPGKKAA